MKLDSMRSSLIGGVFVVLASVLLGSCGGGGASSGAPVGGPPQILPAVATLYAGVEYTFTVAGGRPPYNLSSSEPQLLAVPTTLNGSFFTVVPNNPGVVDTGLPAGALPIRTVTITMRDSVGSTAATSGLTVAQNFFTAYGVSYSSNCVAISGSSTPPAACAGGETAVELSAIINGNLVGNRTYRFEVLRGPFFWVFPNGQIAGNTITVTTDHEGDAHAVFRVNSNVGTQLGVFRVTDVATGVSTTQVFTINGVPLSGALTAIPDNFTLTGPTTAQCGTGSGDFFVFDGTPPYTAVSTFPFQLLVTPDVSSEQPGRFTWTATNPFFCLDPGVIVIRDANNRSVTVEVTTERGSDEPPPPPIEVTPGSVSLSCGTSGSVLIVGGGDSPTVSVASPDPRITATVSDRVVTLTRISPDVPPVLPASPTPGVPNPITFSLLATDGTTTIGIGVIAPSHCPP